MGEERNVAVEGGLIPFPTHLIAYALGALIAGVSMELALVLFSVVMLSLMVGRVGAIAAVKADE